MGRFLRFPIGLLVLDPDVIAQEIVDDLESTLEQFRLIANDLGGARAIED